MKYFVSWEIDIEADSAEAAALEALRMQRDPESAATVFHVIDEMGMDHEIDVADAALVPVAYRELKATVRDLGGAHPLKHYQVELLRGALGDCLHQINQMRGLFPDDDGQIQQAVEVAEAALEATQ